MVFDEVLFPVDIAYGSEGGPIRRTDIVVLDSGFEERNTSWLKSRHRYNISYGVKTYDQLHAIIEFWEARNGPLRGFRYKDFSDFRSSPPQTAITATDQLIGTGDGIEVDFQLVKVYTNGGNSYTRTINKPTASTLLIAINDVPQGSGFTVDTTTGIVTFSVAPGGGLSVKAGYEFEVPVRFDADELTINLASFRHGTLTDIIAIELRI